MFSFVANTTSGAPIGSSARQLRGTVSCPPEMMSSSLKSEPPHRPAGVDVRQWRNMMNDLNNMDHTQSLVTVIRR